MNYDLPISELEVLRRHQHNVSGKEYVKVPCILMPSKGSSAEFISDLGIDRFTVYRYWDLYKTGGLDSVLDNGQKDCWFFLSSHELSLLRSELKHTLYTDSKPVAKWIKDDLGVDYTPQGIVDLLNRIGFSHKKTMEVPYESSEEKQVAFMEELSKVLEDSEEKSVVYYAGGVHLTHNLLSAYAWIEKGQDFEQPSVSGRQRVNISGLVNVKDPKDVIYVDCESVNAQSTKGLYQKVPDKHPKAKKVYIIAENARYYRNKELTEWVWNTEMKQVFLPPCSPNLNLIERPWMLHPFTGQRNCFAKQFMIFLKISNSISQSWSYSLL